MILYNLRGWRRCPHPVASLSICCYRFFALLVLQSPKKSPEWLLSCVSFCLSIVSDDTPMTSLSHCLKAAMFILLICSSSLRCFAFSSSICHLSIYPFYPFGWFVRPIFLVSSCLPGFAVCIFPYVDFQRFFGRKSVESNCKLYYISCIIYPTPEWLLFCGFFRSSFHDAFDNVFRWLFLQYREIEMFPIVGHELDILWFKLRDILPLLFATTFSLNSKLDC